MQDINKIKIAQLIHVTDRCLSNDDVREQWIFRKHDATSFHAEITRFPNPLTTMTQPSPYILTNDVSTHYNSLYKIACMYINKAENETCHLRRLSHYCHL